MLSAGWNSTWANPISGIPRSRTFGLVSTATSPAAFCDASAMPEARAVRAARSGCTSSRLAQDSGSPPTYGMATPSGRLKVTNIRP